MNIDFIDKPEKIDDVLTWLKHERKVGVDTETNSLDPLKSKVLLVQIGTPTKQFVLDTARIGKNRMLEFFNALNNPKLVKILHNSNFDYQHIKSNYGVELSNMKCTMLGEQLLIQGRKQSAGLDAVVKKYMGIELDKSVRETFQHHRFGETFSKNQIDYAAEDVLYLVPLYKKIQLLLDQRDMNELSELEYETAAVLGDMTLDGIYLHVDKWLPLEEKAKDRVKEAKEKLDEHFKDFIEEQTTYDLFGAHKHEINYDSPKQVLPLLKEATGVLLASTDAKYLEFYKDRYQVIHDLVTYRQEQKKITTYGSSFLDYISSIDNRIHSRFRQLRAQTGRISSDAPNMMNLPKEQEYRTPFGVQDPSWNFISADFSGQELRLLAHAAEEEKMIEALHKNIDLHRYSASLLFNKDYDAISEKERNQCKSISFSLLYGAGPKKLSVQLKISFDDAKALMERYFTVFPNVRQFMIDIVERVEKEKYGLSPLDKRRVDLSHVDWDNKAMVAHAVNQCKNLPFQGAGASTIKLALARLRRRIKKDNLNAMIVNSIHDEILVESSGDDAETVKNVIELEMKAAFKHYAPSVPMDVTAKVGKHWIH